MPLLILNYWKEILCGIILVSLGIYIGVLRLEVGHYKAKAIDIEAKFDAAVHKAEVEALAKAKLNDELTKKTEEAEKFHSVAENLFNEKQVEVQKRIKSDKELNALKLTIATVELFNSSKSEPNQQAATSETNTGNAGDTEAIKKSLADLLIVANENDREHLKCIHQVSMWQVFWKGYEDAYEH